VPTNTEIAALRRQLYSIGYRVVAITAGQKFPWQKRWPELARQDPPHACVWIDERMPGTGIYTAGLRPVDVDLDDPVLAAAMCAYVEALGPAPYRYRAGSPRRLYLFRAAEGSPKKLYVCHEPSKARVEVLGDGQQFFAFGTHPESGEQLQWSVSPEAIPRDDLPTLSESQVVALLDHAATLIDATRCTHRPKPEPCDGDRHRGLHNRATTQTPLGSAGQPPQKPQKEFHLPHIPSTSHAWPLADLVAALDAIPCPASYDAWCQLSCAYFHACGGSSEGHSVWKLWCSAGPNYSPAAADALWSSFYDAPEYFSAGTLVHTAREHDPDWDRPSRAACPPLACFSRRSISACL
jgi:hypothetical protein